VTSRNYPPQHDKNKKASDHDARIIHVSLGDGGYGGENEENGSQSEPENRDPPADDGERSKVEWSLHKGFPSDSESHQNGHHVRNLEADSSDGGDGIKSSRASKRGTHKGGTENKGAANNAEGLLGPRIHLSEIFGTWNSTITHHGESNTGGDCYTTDSCKENIDACDCCESQTTPVSSSVNINLNDRVSG